jgi:hypothetical protein
MCFGMRVTVEFDKFFLALFQRLVVAAETIAKNTAPSPFAVEFQLLIGGSMLKGSMLAKKVGASVPTDITDAPTGQRVVVVGIDAQGAYGAPLATGASIVGSVGPGTNTPTPATFTPTIPPGLATFTDQAGVLHTNVQTILDGILAATTPIDTNDQFTVSYAITNADGTAGDTGSAPVVITPGTEASEVLVFPPAAPSSAAWRNPPKQGR